VPADAAVKAPAVDMDCVLARTSEGTRRMSSRDAELGSKLRSTLFLVTGRQTLGELLSLAGGLAHVVEAQVRSLLESGLIVVVDRRGPTQADLEPVPVAAARIQLLKRIEVAGVAVSGPAERLRAARSLPELAEHARSAAVGIQQLLGRPAAEEFWNHARAILLHWQERDAGTRA
jgi:hypothetical protein